ncbi:all-trans-phytoene synthase [Variibacter gotjawalensis]|uniref:All-trans-phytoene synthase n=1 Tax=Variibacter gotjawalensis TaxID=1333996 RepID=A0A0S3PUI4_9BRAD|nr:presqualene diphosphate synthase HpnD [Variibacter gotjawalensis]NIK49933.1 phytoene synthase [Variibacter gotjawalensis]RZS45932.1 farnesyl-diphosphate farnesyltransferase [Variibacter gotjawalensis]BAT59607.1 all-trans-phytoene synthase [Variibacter gotjawalensis]
MSVAPTTEEPTAATRAGGSSFYMAMRILPRAQRDAMFEIYSFCRRVDDIADEGGPRDERKLALKAWHSDIDALYAGERVIGLDGLARAVKEFGLRREDFHAVIDGMEMDAIEDIRAPDWATLDLYCDRVASAVGRLSVRVFGMEEQAGIDLAYHLGRALQLTNISRDIDEDADIGRLYLPREALEAAGITTTDPHAAIASPRIGEVGNAVLARARDHFARADAIMAAAPRRTVKAPRIMGEAYRAIFDGLVARGFAPPRERVSISKPKLLIAILKYAFI